MHKLTKRTGGLSGAFVGSKDQDMFVISSSGIVIRVQPAQIRRVGRASQGVRTMRVEEGARVVALSPVVMQAQADEAGQAEAAGEPEEEPVEDLELTSPEPKPAPRKTSPAPKSTARKTSTARGATARKTSTAKAATARKKTATKKKTTTRKAATARKGMTVTARKAAAAKKSTAKKSTGKKAAPRRAAGSATQPRCSAPWST